MRNLTSYWYREKLHPALFLMLPLAGLFGLGVSARRWLYKKKIISSERSPVPIIVVGNISIGGTGKTPMVIWLANFLKQQGFSPGIISRGVGGKKHMLPYLVTTNDAPSLVGDEALLLLQRTRCPVMIGRKRAEVARVLLQQFPNCDVIISDDGLQHYKMARDIEIVMIDRLRKLGNQFLLPAGPLRELSSRLKNVNFVIQLELLPKQFVSLLHEQSISLENLPRKIHAVAGIGNPQNFFLTLTELGFEIIPHIFPDHHHYKENDLNFNDDLPIVMTEKDAVKCKAFAKKNYWYLEVAAKLKDGFADQLLLQLTKMTENETCKNLAC